MRILLSAFSCSPDRGSEPGIGWNWVRQVSRHHEVWVLMLGEYREQMEKALTPNIHPVYVPSPQNYYRLVDSGLRGSEWVYYYWWQWKAYRVAKKLHAEIGFDLAHHVTFGSWRAPSFLSLLPIPFIWGPIGGGESVPKSLRRELGWKGHLFETIRDLSQRASRWDPCVRLTMRRARVILAANRETCEILPRRFQAKARTLFNTGMSVAETDQAPAIPRKPGEFLVLFVARLDPHKGGTLAIQAFQQFATQRGNARLIIIGDGPERARLVALASSMGLAERVRFLGKVPRQEVFGWMKAMDVLLFPSLRDSGGFVLLEAMLETKPVVCLDLGGPGEIVTGDCGIKVAAETSGQVVADLAAALERLAGDAALRQALGAAGRRRILERFDWDEKGRQMLAIYDQVLNRPPAVPAVG